MEKRANAVTFKGSPLTLVGPQLKPGDKAPDFEVVNGSLEIVKLGSTPAKARMFSVVPSLDTPVCSQQTKKFDESVAALKDKAVCYTVSLDMPFAQKRFCGSENITNIQTLSDHREAAFGRAYGVLIKDLRLLARAMGFEGLAGSRMSVLIVVGICWLALFLPGAPSPWPEIVRILDNPTLPVGDKVRATFTNWFSLLMIAATLLWIAAAAFNGAPILP